MRRLLSFTMNGDIEVIRQQFLVVNNFFIPRHSGHLLISLVNRWFAIYLWIKTRFLESQENNIFRSCCLLPKNSPLYDIACHLIANLHVLSRLIQVDWHLLVFRCIASILSFGSPDFSDVEAIRRTEQCCRPSRRWRLARERTAGVGLWVQRWCSFGPSSLGHHSNLPMEKTWLPNPAGASAHAQG